MLLRLIDFMQGQGITLMLTALNSGITEHIDENVSSLVDSWLLVKDVELNGERNRAIFIMKSRGMEHSKEVREFVIDSGGLHLIKVHRGPDGVLVGSARVAKENEEIFSAKEDGRGHFKKTAKKIKK
jgi:circadian clock protein KaiC